MLEFITDLFRNSWSLIAEMAPYLLFGFGAAGLLHILIRADFIERHIGKPGLRSVIKASLLGVPVPLCSCSVIPVAASIRKSGASRGATASFLSSTPQTGVDSILATYALLGGMFTVVRVVVAFICGIAAGYLIELFCQRRPEPSNAEESEKTNANLETGGGQAEESSCCHSESKRNWRDGLYYGLVTLPKDLAGALVFGLFLAGLITTLLPQDLLSGSLSSGPAAFLLATLISLPLYVCATGSIPMAYALIAAGLSPGAALVFLITGPATNTATIVTVWKMLGRIPTAIYLISLVAISWIAGALLNMTLADSFSETASHHATEMQIGVWQHASGVALILILSLNLILPLLNKKKSCCSGS